MRTEAAPNLPAGQPLLFFSPFSSEYLPPMKNHMRAKTKKRAQKSRQPRACAYIYKVWAVRGRRPPRGRAEGARLHTFLPLHGVGLVFFG